MPMYLRTDEAITALLSLWETDNIQKEIRDGKMKKDIFKEDTQRVAQEGVQLHSEAMLQ